MKKYYWITLLIVIICSSIFVGCANEESTANLRVRFNEDVSSRSDTRDMYSPSGEGLDIYGYILEGIGPNEQTLSITTSSSQVEINGLVIGTWNLFVTAINQQGTPLATGEATFQLSTKDNTVDIIIDTLIGSGTVNISLYWGEEVFNDITLSLGIKKQSENLIDVSEDVTIFESSSSAIYEASLDAGVYEIYYSLYSEEVLLTGGVDVIRILDEKETVANINLEIKKTTPEATSITIRSTFGETIEGTITGLSEIVLPNTQIQASFYDENEEPHTYEVKWYLDGAFLATGENVEFSTFTGEHRLDAIAEGTLIGNIGASTKTFKATVEQEGSLPYIVSSITSSDTDKNNNLYYLNQVTDSQFLRDGRIVISSSQGLQICDILNDELIVLQSYTTSGNGISVASDPYPTQGISDIAVDSTDDIVITTAKDLSIVVVYKYDTNDGSLTKIGSFDPATTDWTTTISNVVLDKAHDYAYLVDRATNKMRSFDYSVQPLSLYSNVSLMQLNYYIDDASILNISNDNTKLVISSPTNNTFHHYTITYKSTGNPSIGYGGNSGVSSSVGALQYVKHIGNTAHVLTNNGLYTYMLGTGFEYEYVAKVGTTSNQIKELIYDSLYEIGWTVEMDSQLLIRALTIGSSLDYETGSLIIDTLSTPRLSYSPQGNMMTLIGSSSLSLLRLNDN